MASRSGVFVLQNDGDLVPMQPAEFDTEDQFQALLAHHPDLLVGDQIDTDNPRRFILIQRELPIAMEPDESGRWSLDHLFLDQDGIPTLVEVKRRSDMRLRREVAAQMLDYAANFANYWSVGKLQTSFEQTCKAADRTSDVTLSDLVNPGQTSEQFWETVHSNILAGRIRILFIADEIPAELRRIVEFLNRQMDPAEVLAIELRHYAGKGLKTIVPMVFGQSEDSAKQRLGGKAKRWDEQRLFAKLATHGKIGQKELAAAQKIFDWMRGGGHALVYGTGTENGSVYPLLKADGIQINPAYLSSDGKLWLQFGSLANKPIFSDAEKRRELLRRFAAVNSSGLTDDQINAYRALPLTTVTSDPEGVEKVLSALKWMEGQLNQQQQI